MYLAGREQGDNEREHSTHSDNKYIGPPNQGDLQEELLQTNIHITLINNYDADYINYSLLIMIVTPAVCCAWLAHHVPGKRHLQHR